MDLFFNRNKNKAIFKDKKCYRFAKNYRNKYPRIFVALSISVVGRDLGTFNGSSHI